jgi:N-acetylmuramoyl-L-alanine amidase
MKRLSTDFIVVHCSATPEDMDIGAEEIRRWHKERGWSDIGYHMVIRRNGSIEFGRDDDAVGAHVRGYNDNSIGICLVGGTNKKQKPENNFTPAQFKSLARSLRFYRAIYPGAEILGHRDLDGGKACPSFDVPSWLSRQNLKQ